MVENELVQIADILPPAAPFLVSASIELYLFVLIIFFVFAGTGLWRSRKQRFKRLRRQYLNHKVDSRYCAFQISSLLCHSDTHQNNHVWQTYAKQLQRACYSRHSLDDGAMNQLLNDTEQWL